MTYYVFAIGGTGARCLESLVYLCAMGLGPVKIHPILVDPDIGNGNRNRTIELINRYKNIRNQIENPQEGSLFYTDITYEATDAEKDIHKKIPNLFNPNTNLPSGMNTLAHFIEYNTALSNDNKKLLADLLFSNDELNMKMTQGYRGVPSIGSVLMTGIKEYPFWNVFINSLKAETNDKVFIFASVFGGTGASGYPVISQLIKNEVKNSEVGGALILPYFRLRDPQDLLLDDKFSKLKDEKVLPNFNSFLLNTKAACEFYQNNFSKNDANYVLGDNTDFGKLYDNYQIGSSEQKNDAHMIELMAAYAALDFWNKPQGKHKEFYHLQVHNPEGDSDKEYKIISSDLPQLKKIKPFERFALVHHYIDDIFKMVEKSNSGKLDKIAWIRRMQYRGKDVLNQKSNLTALYEFCNSFKEWIRQNHKNEAELDLLDDDLDMKFLVSENKEKYSRFHISKLDVSLYRKNKKKTNFVDCFISSLSKASLVKGGY